MHHSRRKHPELTELEIIERIKSGSLVVDFDTQQVYSATCTGAAKNSKRKALHPIRIRLSGRTSKRPIVRIKWNGKRRHIYCHTLAWLAHTLMPIPAGYEVHHGEEGPLCWHPRNLECLTHEEHKARHGAIYEEEEFT